LRFFRSELSVFRLRCILIVNTLSMFKKLSLFYILIILSSCGKDVVIIEEPNPTKETDEIYEVNLVGFTTDENRNYISDSEVSVDGYNIISDENGLFHFENIFVGRKGKAVFVKKEGFLPSIYRVARHSELTQVVMNLQMATAQGITTIDNSGGTIQDENGKLTISENTVNSSTDFTFQSYFGEDVNKGNMDQLIFGVSTEFLLKETSFYIDGTSPLNTNSVLDVELDMDKFKNKDISNLAIFCYNEQEFRWKEKNLSLMTNGDKLSVSVDSYGWWTIAEKVPAQYGFVTLEGSEESRIGNAEAKLSYGNKNYDGSILYTNAAGSIETYFPAEIPITASLNNGEFRSVNESGLAKNDFITSCDIIFEEEVQSDIFGKVYECDFALSNGIVVIISDGQHKIRHIEDGLFVDHSFSTDEEVELHFYSEDFERLNTKISDVESLRTGLTDFLSCTNLNEKLVVSDANNLLQDFDMCRVKVRPNETVVIGERSNGDVFLVSFDGKSKGKYDGLFFFPDTLLDDVRSEVTVNIVLYDEVENKVGGFINTEYISTGEELSISFIGNID